jgi:predicted type IV restriction endonuclease
MNHETDAAAPESPSAPLKAKYSNSPKWEVNAKSRIQQGIKRLSKPTMMLREKDAAEADTRHLVTDFLVDVLGFDKYEDLTAEFNVKGDWADYGIRVDKQLTAFVEVKRIAQKLSVTHLKQVESYALKEGVQWAFLTNAQVWQIYYVQPVKGQQSEVSLVFEVDLLDDSVRPSQKTDLLFLISREALTRGLLEDYRSAQNAVSPKTLKPILLSSEVLATVRKEVRRKTKHLVEEKDLKAAISRLLEE